MRSPLIGITSFETQFASGKPMYGIRPTYPHAVAKAGGAPVIIPLEADKDALRRIYDNLDGLVISGGGDIQPSRYQAETISPYTANISEVRDEVEIQLVEWAIEDDKPLLAICRGHQVFNIVLGGTIVQDIQDELEGSLRHEAPNDSWFSRTVHEVNISPNSLLHQALGIEGNQLEVNSLHHQAIDRVAPGLQVTATAGDEIVEGIELPDKRFAVGVQWHPEALVDEIEPMLNLFKSFVDSCREDH